MLQIGDCLKPGTYPSDELKECLGVVHCVGALIDGFNYKTLIKSSIQETVVSAIRSPWKLFSVLETEKN